MRDGGYTGVDLQRYLAGAQISPSGLGVHFPRLDADLYIPALLEGFLGSRRWIAAQTVAREARLPAKPNLLRQG